MSKNAEKWIVRAALFCIFGATLFLLLYNGIKNSSFLDASLSTCLNVVAIFALSYSLTQSRNDKRKCMEVIERISSDIQDIIGEESAYIITETTDSKQLTLRNRKVSNKIALLERTPGDVEIIMRIRKNFDEYETKISDGIHDVRLLRGKELELRRSLDLVDDDLDRLKISLYS